VLAVDKEGVAEDCLKSKFSVRYGDIEWGGQVSAAWYVHLTDSSEAPAPTRHTRYTVTEGLRRAQARLTQPVYRP
jgi:hypothetical protein